jgi:uncharacterized membrane protein YuzA (DUF378 family)
LAAQVFELFAALFFVVFALNVALAGVGDLRLFEVVLGIEGPMMLSL